MTEMATEAVQMAFDGAQEIYEVIGSKLLALGVNITESQVEAVAYAVLAHLERKYLQMTQGKHLATRKDDEKEIQRLRDVLDQISREGECVYARSLALKALADMTKLRKSK